MSPRACQRTNCGATIRRPKPNQRYCSAACKQDAYRDRTASQRRNTEPSQNDRVQRVLELQGSIGITQEDFTGPNVIDGMSAITRIGARIHDLKTKRGLRFDPAAGERNGFQIYRLATETA
jgi:hypothetical protein